MRRIFSAIIALIMIAGALPSAYAENMGIFRELYVAESGNDNNDGSSGKPFKTIERAKEAAAEISDAMTGDIVVHIASGTYYQDDTLRFEPADSGKNGYKIIYRGDDVKNTVISGGKRISGFVPSSKGDGIWEANAEEFDSILQLDVNGNRRYPAKHPVQIKGVKKSDNASKEKGKTLVYDDNPYNYCDPETTYTYDGMYLSKSDFGFYENPEDILFRWEHEWTTRIVPVSEIMQDPDSPNQLIVRMRPGYYNFMVQGSRYNNTYPKPNRNFMVMNAMELLDEPGEFYFNRKTKKLYYIPTEDEDMKSAEIVAPKLESLIFMAGDDVDKKISGITFENITFRDTKWDYLRGMSGDQAVATVGERIAAIGFRGVSLKYAENISFTGNVFSNMGGTAVEFLNACTDCVVRGNAFYDIGETAISIGQKNHGDQALGADGISNPVPAEHKDDPVDLVGSITTRIDASTYMNDRNDSGVNYSALAYPGFGGPDDNEASGQYELINKTWVDDDSFRKTEKTVPYSKKWTDNVSIQNGEKPWVKFELEKPYSLDEVIVSFDPEYVTASEKSDFEIIASNDIDFSEYDTIKTVNGAAPSDINRYSVESDKKYRYVMIRSLDSKVFSLSRVWITTKDIKPYVKNQRCKDFVIENNYCERIGVDFTRSIGLIITHGADFKITHNEFRDIGYSGTSIGYSWGLHVISCYNMNVSYNYVFDVTHAGYDGGGMYVLGPQVDSVYHNNFINGVNLGINGFYTDNGSRYETINGNVIVGCSSSLSPYTTGTITGIKENTYFDNYSTSSVVRDGAAADNDFEQPKIMPIGTPISGEAYATMTDAGLEAEYEHIKELIPKGRDNLPYKYDLNYSAMSAERIFLADETKKALTESMSNTLKNGKFGSGLGMFPYEYKQRLEDMINYYEGATNSDMYMRHTAARELEYEMQGALRRYSFDETLKMCEEKLELAKENTADPSGWGSCDKYPADAVAAFETAVNEVKSEFSDTLTTAERFPLLTKLEDAYNTLEDKRNSAAIENVYVKNAVKTEIDSQNRCVTIYMPEGSGTLVSGISIKTTANSQIAKMIGDEMELSKPVQIPVYCKGNGRYRIWTFKMEYYKPNQTENLGDAEWLVTTSEKDMIKKYADGTSLPAGEYIYMANGYSDAAKGASVSFAPMSGSESKSFTAVIGADNPYVQERSSAVQQRCEAEFTDKTVKFYKVINGNRTLITEKNNINVKYGEKNTLKYEIEEIGNNLYFKLYLNGELILSPVVEKYSYGRFFGFYNPHMNIKIYNK